MVKKWQSQPEGGWLETVLFGLITTETITLPVSPMCSESKVFGVFYSSFTVVGRYLAGRWTYLHGCTEAMGGPVIWGKGSIVIVLLAWSWLKSSYIISTDKAFIDYITDTRNFILTASKIITHYGYTVYVSAIKVLQVLFRVCSHFMSI